MAYLHTAPNPEPGSAAALVRFTALVRGWPVPPPMLVLLGMLSTQVGAAVAKQLFGVAGPFGVTLLRLGFAALLLVAVCRPSLRLSRAELGLVLAFGTTLGAMNLCFYLTMSRIPLGVAVTIGFLGPLVVALAASRRWTDVVWALLAGGGVALLGGTGAGLDRVGLLGACALAVLWGGYVVLGGALSRRLPGNRGLALAMLWAALCVAPLGVADAGGRLVVPWLLLVGVGVAALSSLVPYTLELKAMRELPPRLFAVLLSLEPAIAALAGLAILGEWLSLPQLAGIALVVTASVGATRGVAAARP